MTMTRFKSARGTAMLEVALTLPLVLLISVGIFEFGRAYETMQVLTNAAREGARVAILPGQPTNAVKTRVNTYMTLGGLGSCDSCIVVSTTQISIGGTSTAPGSKVTVNYPFAFMVLQPIANLVVRGSTLGAGFTMSAAAEMRNEQ
jgi:Flp pilus assembly protein TadG